MLERIVELALRYKFLVIIGFGVVIFLGVRSLGRIPIDAFPDVTPVQVNIFTEAEGFSPEEVEKLVTFPVESAMAGLPNVELIRSLTIFGVSVVTVFFTDDTDIYFARQLVMGRLEDARERIPEGLGRPAMGPNTTGLGQIFQYSVKSNAQKNALMETRTLQDWTLRMHLRTVPGVDDVLSMGGYEKQFQVLFKPERLVKYGLTLSELIDRIAKNNRAVGGQFIVRNREEYLVRGLGWAQGVEDLRKIIVKEDGGTPLYLGDLAEVVEGPAVRRGAVTINGEEATIGIALKRTGENTKKVIDAIKEKWQTVKQALPRGTEIVPFYDQTELVDKAVNTAERALLEGGILIAVVLFFFLGEVRSALVVVSAVPITMLIAFFLMDLYGLSANLMSLGGLAVGIGMMIDGAVVMVENSFRLLSERKGGKEHKDFYILEAAREVVQPVAFAILIIIVVFLPLFTLAGIEGKMFKPMALAISFAMTGSLIVSLTLIPVLSSWFLKVKEEKDSFLVRTCKRGYLPLLEWGLKRQVLTIALAVLLFIVSLSTLPFIGTEFIPILEEGSIQLRITNIPSASLDEALDVAKKAEKVLLQFPEVILAHSKIGRAEKGDTEEVNNIETYVRLKPIEEWRKALDKTALTKEMHQRLEQSIPQALFSFGQPIQMRVDELISGIRAMLAVKIYGEDFTRLSRLAEEVKGVLGTVQGTTDLQVETVTGKPALNIRVNREAAARYGLNVDDVLEVVRTGLGGQVVSNILDGVKRFDLLVRFEEASRDDVEKISAIPIRTQTGALVPLGKVAEISLSSGLARIRREKLARYIVIQCNVVGRDIGGYVTEAQQKIAARVKLPEGYYMDWGGQFENQRRAMRTLSIVVPATIFLIFVLLYTAFNSVKYALLIISNVPFSAIGGIIALLISGQYLSVPSAIGFIAVFGVAMLNGVVLVSYFIQLRNQGLELGEVVRRGCLLRLRPVLMTATVAILGLVPLLVSTGVGAEVQRPLAAVVVGGLITSTALTLLILPLIYFLVESRTEATQESLNSDSEEKT